MMKPTRDMLVFQLEDMTADRDRWKERCELESEIENIDKKTIENLTADRDRWKAEAMAARDAIETFPITIVEQLLVIPECNEKLSLYLESRIDRTTRRGPEG